MSIKLHSVENGNIPSEEKVWLQVMADTNLRHHAIVDNTFTAGDKVSNEFRHIYVFPNKQVQRNDYVCLHTEVGTDYSTTEKNQLGGTTHHFFWNAKSCVWNDNGKDSAVLIKFSPIGSLPAKAN